MHPMASVFPPPPPPPLPIHPSNGASRANCASALTVIPPSPSRREIPRGPQTERRLDGVFTEASVNCWPSIQECSPPPPLPFCIFFFIISKGKAMLWSKRARDQTPDVTPLLTYGLTRELEVDARVISLSLSLCHVVNGFYSAIYTLSP